MNIQTKQKGNAMKDYEYESYEDIERDPKSQIGVRVTHCGKLPEHAGSHSWDLCVPCFKFGQTDEDEKSEYLEAGHTWLITMLDNKGEWNNLERTHKRDDGVMAWENEEGEVYKLPLVPQGHISMEFMFPSIYRCEICDTILYDAPMNSKWNYR